MLALRAAAVVFFSSLYTSTVVAQELTPQDTQIYEQLQDLDGDASREELFALTLPSEDVDGAMEMFSLWGPFRFPNDADYDVIESKPRENAIFGIDISHHNGPGFPFADLKQRRISFVYMKASQGTGFKDKRFASNWQTAGDLPPGDQVHRGAYHFLSALTDPAEQANAFVAVLAANGGLQDTDMPPVVDLEWDMGSGVDRWASVPADEIVPRLKIFLDIVEKRTGRVPMIYTARSWWRERLGGDQGFDQLARYPIWIADYSKSSRGIEVPRVPNSADFAIWQFTDSANLASGFAGSFDANIFKYASHPDEFYQELGVSPF